MIADVTMDYINADGRGEVWKGNPHIMEFNGMADVVIE